MTTNQSPIRRKDVGGFDIHEDMSNLSIASDSSGKSQNKTVYINRPTVDAPKHQVALPLTTSTKLNQQCPPALPKYQLLRDYSPPAYDFVSTDDKVLYQPSKPANLVVGFSSSSPTPSKHSASQYSSMTTPANGGDSATHELDDTKDQAVDKHDEEIFRLKSQLQAANDEIARQTRELVQQRITQDSIDQVLGSPSEAHFSMNIGLEPHLSGRDAGMFMQRSPTTSPAPFEQFQGPWGNGMVTSPPPEQNFPLPAWHPSVTSPWSNRDSRTIGARLPSAPQPQRPNALRLETYENELPYPLPTTNMSFEQGFRRTSMPNTRPGSAFGSYYGGVDPYQADLSPELSPSMSPTLMHNFRGFQQAQMPYQPRSTGTPLSATALEFNSGNLAEEGYGSAAPWNASATTESTSNYMAPMEPMNYRRLLDRNMSCDWKYIVDKIVCNNDQQASIFLQQKLKIATPEQKRELVDAIISQAYPLVINRFGNFLVQRCLEHGSSDQVIAIANAIRGNTLSLSMDAFGCHVVQKAFDVVPEEFKAIMVHELLRRIPETVIHRYACHVWQKLFELRWSDSPPQIMKYVNEALRGMWHEVALGETGSLVVQNIFENCLEEDKRAAINEVLASIDIVAHGQFGNWCIQHICEHGAPPDKSRAIEHVLRFATEYSTDQFASKVVEKCLKVGGPDFLERYLERVCEGRPDRPRMPLIDISGDQYGNYLVQYILINANPHHREVVANHVRKHMVSLRGSKFGSRVAMLCCNPASSTRPGPPVVMPMTSRYAPVGVMGGFPRPAPGPYR